MERPLTIGYFGDGRWARRALDRIVERPELRVLFIVGRHGDPDPELRAYAERLDVPFATDPDVNRPDFVDAVRQYEADLHVSMSFDQILGRELIDLAPEGFINCHAGALPFYRGRNVLNWALINGEDRFGVTVHYVEETIDTGDIILQRFADIAETDDYASLLDKAVALCADVLPDALLQIRAGEVDPTPQDEIHPVGFYCSGRREGDEWIDWTWTSERIHNFVRGIAPPAPGARTLLGDDRLALLRTELIDEAPAYIDRPGTVVGRDPEGIVVKTGDTSIRVRRVADLDPDDGLSNERVPEHPIGTVFGVNPRREMERLRGRVRALEQQLQYDAADKSGEENRA
ncbi:MAG: methionyl-tRNA formyltransferase [Salinivenus sp.]